jgi:hypothetical protein
VFVRRRRKEESKQNQQRSCIASSFSFFVLSFYDVCSAAGLNVSIYLNSSYCFILTIFPDSFSGL